MSKKLVVLGAKLKCTQGLAPGSLVVLPGIATADDKPLATVDDFVPLVNIQAFGMCQAPSNPQVAAATAAAMGVLTPQPCIPVVAAPWSPGSSISEYSGKAALTDDSTCNCMWSGQISITDSGTAMTTD
jgi:Domain of unknown function (DUF4280)